MLNVYGAEKTNHYQHIAMEKSRLHIPLLFGMDVIHGDTRRSLCRWPGCELGPEAGCGRGAHSAATRRGRMAFRGSFRRWWILPAMRAGAASCESAGEDPYLGSAIARGWVKGLSAGRSEQAGFGAVSVKHFAAYGAAIAGRDYNATDMSDITLRQVYLPPYHAAVDAGAATVMSSFNSINGVPATANPYTLTQILRKEWGFDGLVVSDWGAVARVLNHCHWSGWRDGGAQGA
jgi:beta-glucosidase